MSGVPPGTPPGPDDRFAGADVVPVQFPDGTVRRVAGPTARAMRLPAAESMQASGPVGPTVDLSPAPAPAAPEAPAQTFGPGSLAPAVPEGPQQVAFPPAQPTAARALVARQENAQERLAEADASPPAPSPEAAGQYQQLARAATSGDAQAVAQLTLAARRGDPLAIETLEDLAALQEAGVLRPRGGGGGGPRVTQTATTTLRQPGREATAEEAAALQGARERQDAAERDYVRSLGQQFEAEAGAMNDAAAAMERGQVDLEAARARNEAARRTQQAELERRERELDGLMREIGSQRVDSSRLFGRGQTRNRAGAAIALVLGGIGDAFTGGNAGMQTALRIINGAVDDDIRAQEQTLSHRRSVAGQRRGLLAEMRARFGSDEAARQAARAAMVEDTARQVRALQQRAQSEAHRGQLGQLLAQLEQQKAAALQAAVVEGLGTTEIVTQQQTRRGGGGGRRQQFNFSAALPESGEFESGELDRLGQQEQEAEDGLESVDAALAALEQTSLTGPIAGRLPAFTAEARELERLLGQAALPAVARAFGAANDGQVHMMRDLLGLTRTSSAEEIRTALMRARGRLTRQLRTAQLSVGRGAVQENRARQSDVGRSVALESGRSEDVAPSFTPLVRGGR